MEISRDESAIMKGLAILFIALHNFYHLELFGFIQENETLFDIRRSQEIFSYLLNPDGYFLCHFFSFIGWCGVPIFVFLSGYGLVKKYEKGPAFIERKAYLKYNYLKLFFLVLPGALFFIFIQLSQGNWLRACFSVFSLTFTNPLFGCFISLPSAAPPYWYFSLTFQLYLIYLLFNKVRNNKLLYYLFLVFLLLYFVFNPDYGVDFKWLRYIRLNSFGWLPVFITGILFARNSGRLISVSRNILFLMGLAISSFVFLFLTNLNYYSWVLMPFVSVVFFLSLGFFINKIKSLRTACVYLGKLSPFIFVSHPIAIFFMQLYFNSISFQKMDTPMLAFAYGCFYMTICLFISLLFKTIRS